MNTKGMGSNQRVLLSFLKRYRDVFGKTTLHSIANGEKRVAISLEKRGLIKVIRYDKAQWQVKAL